MTTIAILGAAGRMGQALIRCTPRVTGLKLTAALECAGHPALGQDAEISWLDGLTSPLCGQAPVPVAPTPRTVALKIKLDSDLPIAEVGLSCGSWHGSDSLGSGESVARFDARPGSCTLTLQGTVPMTTQVQVPETGADLRCVVRAGRLACN